jgi:GR25 family glycosyltransferase involved in LPS biosynthesis
MLPYDVMPQRIFVVARANHKNRWAKMESEIEKANRFGWGMDGVPLVKWTDPDRDRMFIPPCWPHRPGHYAATVAHYRVMEEMWVGGIDVAMILEDDVEFFDGVKMLPDFLEEIHNHYPDWMMLYIGGAKDKMRVPEERPSKLVRRLKGATGQHAYIVNRHGIRRVLDHLTVQNRRCVDWACHDLMVMEDVAYCPASFMCRQRSWGGGVSVNVNVLKWSEEP